MVDLVFWITSVESEYVHTQYVVQAPAVSPGPLSCNGVWNGAEVSQPAPPWSSIAQQQHLSSDLSWRYLIDLGVLSQRSCGCAPPRTRLLPPPTS